MSFISYTLLVLLTVVLAMGDQQKQFMISFEKDTPNWVIDESKSAVVAAVCL